MALPGEDRANRLPGYPDEARLLIVNADDFGMCHAANVATLRAWREGIVSSATLIVPCPWAAQAMQLLREHPALPFGVHLTLVRDFDLYRWGPLTSREVVSSLIDEEGFFYRGDRIPELLAGAALGEVVAEFRAQIGAVLAAQVRPTHLDWHCLADGGRADIFALTSIWRGSMGWRCASTGGLPPRPAAGRGCRPAITTCWTATDWARTTRRRATRPSCARCRRASASGRSTPASATTRRGRSNRRRGVSAGPISTS